MHSTDRDSHWPQLIKITLYDEHYETPTRVRHRRSKAGAKAHNRAGRTRRALTGTTSKTTQPPPQYKAPLQRPPQAGQQQVYWNTGERAHLIIPRMGPLPRQVQHDADGNTVLNPAPFIPRGTPIGSIPDKDSSKYL